jgi:ubiquinone/menaquinone biosynthesis C-methylase UbiE
LNPEFYSRVAKIFNGYSSGAQRTVIYPDGNPELLFNELAVRSGGPTARLLDVGCADGRTLLEISSSFGEVHGIDLSIGMLEAAQRSLIASNQQNVSFSRRDATATGFPTGSFDIITSRRGPLAAGEFHRLLQPGGVLIYLGIGEEDARSLKEVFGRGQLYGQWDKEPISQTEQHKLEKVGFTVQGKQDFHYQEYFHSSADLSRLLSMVPIFEDYDEERDRKKLKQYVRLASSEDGILMDRHWFVLQARRSS